MSSRLVILLLFAVLLLLLIRHEWGPEVTRLSSRVSAPTGAIAPGEHPLGLGSLLHINGKIAWRDGVIYIPRRVRSGEPMPLLLWLHGGGGSSDDFLHAFPLAEEEGVVVVSLDARHNTWDGIDSPFGPDVLFIDKTLRYIFDRVAIDANRIALGGLSDGGAYALALGRSNGDVFTHLVAVAPGGLNPPAPLAGRPKILVAHGIRDNVYSVYGSRKIIVPRLKAAGYDVTYFEFDGPHWVPEPVAQRILQWLKL